MPDETDTITITKKEYYDLKRSSLLLNALERGGVDNWDWYGEAYQEYFKEAVEASLEEADD